MSDTKKKAVTHNFFVYWAISANDSLKSLYRKEASKELNCEILRLMVIEILESKDNNADENGPVLKQKINKSMIS